MSEPEQRTSEESRSPLDQPWMIFPEIIAVVAILLSSPMYILTLFSDGHFLVGIFASLGLLIAGGYTFRFLKDRHFFLALFPMLGVIVVGLLIHNTLYPQ